jgi:hypothetical protein
MNKLLLATAFALSVVTTQASADTLFPGSFTSDHCSGDGCGTPPFATITGVQGVDSVTLTITLLNGNGIVNTGFDSFAFNLIGDPTITYSGLPPTFTVNDGFNIGSGTGNLSQDPGSYQEDGFKSFEYAINYDSKGGSDPYTTPLTFTISGAGLTLASFTELSTNPPNGGTAAYMMLDIISKETGQTGPVDLSTVAVPGPIVGAGLPGLAVCCLGMLGLARRRIARWRGALFASAH